MQIGESEVKTGEVELEIREAELKDRQAAMLIILDEQRETTRCVTFLRHTSLQKGCPQSLRKPGQAGWDLQQLPGTSSSCLSWVTKFPDRSDSPGNIKRCYCF